MKPGSDTDRHRRKPSPDERMRLAEDLRRSATAGGPPAEELRRFLQEHGLSADDLRGLAQEAGLHLDREALDGLAGDRWLTPEELLRFAACVTGDAERDQRSLRALMGSVARLLGTPDLEELLRRIVDDAVRATGTERGLLLLLEGRDLEIRIARDRQGHDLGPDAPHSASIPRTVMRENQPILVRVRAEKDILDVSDSITPMELRQVMCASVTSRGRTLGVLYVDSKVRGPAFTNADLWLFNSQAGLIGIAIENNRLFHETVRARETSRQLLLARDIQKRLLPAPMARFGGTELAGFSEPSSGVGGDYLDYFSVDPEHVGLCVGDVCGKGIGPAIIMSNVRAQIRALLQARCSLDRLYELLNDALCSELTDGMFVSLFVAVFDSKRMVLEYQNAGHPAALLYRPAADSFRALPPTAAALGVIDASTPTPHAEFAVQREDLLVCYTDGVSERHNPDRQLYGEERVRQTIRAAAHGGGCPQGIVDTIRRDCEAHARGLPPRDDVTVLVARF